MPDKIESSSASKAGGEITKKEAVRRALKSLGYDAKPLQIRDHIKKLHNLEISLDHISNVKTELTREVKEGQPTVAKPASLSAAPGKATPAHGGSGQSISLKDIETVKDLVERVGATPLKKLIDVMAR